MRIGKVRYTEPGLAPSVRCSSTEEIVFDHVDSDNNRVDSNHSILMMEFNDVKGSHVDGFRVTYRYIDPKADKPVEKEVVHGSFKKSNVHHKIIKMGENEYICGAQVWYGNRGTEEEYIGKITLWANSTDSTDGPYQAGDFGEKPDGAPDTEEWHWDTNDGRLFVFGARQDNKAEHKGLKALFFGESLGDAVVAQSAMYPALDDSVQAQSDAFDDMLSTGALINYEYAIKYIDVWFNKVIEGIQITYNLNNGKTYAKMHGSKAASSTTRIQLKPTESVVEIIGVLGDACPSTNLGVRLNLLEFKIRDSKTGMFRNSGTCGRIQDDFKLTTRKDLCVRGPLVGMAGRAELSADGKKQVGLYNVKFFTQIPPWKPVGRVWP